MLDSLSQHRLCVGHGRFDRFDADGSGLISLDNIRPFFEGDVEAQELKSVFDAVDTDHTRSIDKQEFAVRACMLTLRGHRLPSP